MRILSLKFLLFMAAISAPAALHAAAASQPASSENQMDVWWADLEKSEPDASRALLQLSSHPAEAVVFLKRKLRPLNVDVDIINALLTQLGSSKESEWKSAVNELEYFDPRLAMDLPTIMDQVKDSPARQRLAEVLLSLPPGTLVGKQVTLRAVGSDTGWYNFDVRDSKSRNSSVAYGVQGNISQLANAAWIDKPEWTRAIRAIVLLEHIGTPDAVTILKDMATGNPDAQPTKLAKEALTRLANENTVYNSQR